MLGNLHFAIERLQQIEKTGFFDKDQSIHSGPAFLPLCKMASKQC